MRVAPSRVMAKSSAEAEVRSDGTGLFFLPRLGLQVIAGPLAGQVFHVRERGGVLGRDGTLLIDSHGVSRHHAEIRYKGGRFYVSDLDSRNGTFVNERRLRTDWPLEPGDVLQVAENRLRVVLGERLDELGPAAPAKEASRRRASPGESRRAASAILLGAAVGAVAVLLLQSSPLGALRVTSAMAEHAPRAAVATAPVFAPTVAPAERSPEAAPRPAEVALFPSVPSGQVAGGAPAVAAALPKPPPAPEAVVRFNRRGAIAGARPRRSHP